MRILLDTHVYLWWLQANPRLNKAARQKIARAETVYVSSVSIWEAAIKVSIGKLEADIDELIAAIAENQFIELPMRASHAAQLQTLPQIHSDPIDRMLIAQAQVEPLIFLTADQTLQPYSPLVELI